MSSDAVLRQKLAAVWGLLDERTRRLLAANEARSLGYGGVSRVNRACGLSRNAIARGIEEITAGSSPGVGRIRRAGAGRRADHGARSASARGLGPRDRSRYAGGPRVAAALDL